MKTIVLASSLALTILGMATAAAAAMSCSQRNQVCLRFCATNFKNRPGCTSECADAMPKCMQSGCWVTKMASKCGYTKG